MLRRGHDPMAAGAQFGFRPISAFSTPFCTGLDGDQFRCDRRISNRQFHVGAPAAPKTPHAELPGIGVQPHKWSGSPAWIRTTIRTTHAECVSCRVFNGLKCRIGPEKPALVHNSYTAGNRSRCPVTGSRMSGCGGGLWGSAHPAKSPWRSGSSGENVFCSVWR